MVPGHMDPVNSVSEVDWSAPRSVGMLCLWAITLPLYAVMVVMLIRRRASYPIAGRGVLFLLLVAVTALISSSIYTVLYLAYPSGLPCALHACILWLMLPVSLAVSVRGWLLVFRVEIMNFLSELQWRQNKRGQILTARAKDLAAKQEQVMELQPVTSPSSHHHKELMIRKPSPMSVASEGSTRGASSPAPGASSPALPNFGGALSAPTAASATASPALSARHMAAPPALEVRPSVGRAGSVPSTTAPPSPIATFESSPLALMELPSLDASTIEGVWFIHRRRLTEPRRVLAFVGVFSALVVLCVVLVVLNDPDIAMTDDWLAKRGYPPEDARNHFARSHFWSHSPRCLAHSAKLLVFIVGMALVLPTLSWVGFRLWRNSKRMQHRAKEEAAFAALAAASNDAASPNNPKRKSASRGQGGAAGNLDNTKSSHALFSTISDAVSKELDELSAVQVEMLLLIFIGGAVSVLFFLLTAFAYAHVLPLLSCINFALVMASVVPAVARSYSVARKHRAMIARARRRKHGGPGGDGGARGAWGASPSDSGEFVAHHAPLYDLSYLLQDDFAYALLLKFLQKEFSSENLTFYRAAERCAVFCRKIELRHIPSWRVAFGADEEVAGLEAGEDGATMGLHGSDESALESSEGSSSSSSSSSDDESSVGIGHGFGMHRSRRRGVGAGFGAAGRRSRRPTAYMPRSGGGSTPLQRSATLARGIGASPQRGGGSTPQQATSSGLTASAPAGASLNIHVRERESSATHVRRHSGSASNGLLLGAHLPMGGSSSVHATPSATTRGLAVPPASPGNVDLSAPTSPSAMHFGRELVAISGGGATASSAGSTSPPQGAFNSALRHAHSPQRGPSSRVSQATNRASSAKDAHSNIVTSSDTAAAIPVAPSSPEGPGHHPSNSILIRVHEAAIAGSIGSGGGTGGVSSTSSPGLLDGTLDFPLLRAPSGESVTSLPGSVLSTNNGEGGNVSGGSSPQQHPGQSHSPPPPLLQHQLSAPSSRRYPPSPEQGSQQSRRIAINSATATTVAAPSGTTGADTRRERTSRTGAAQSRPGSRPNSRPASRTHSPSRKMLASQLRSQGQKKPRRAATQGVASLLSLREQHMKAIKARNWCLQIWNDFLAPNATFQVNISHDISRALKGQLRLLESWVLPYANKDELDRSSPPVDAPPPPPPFALSALYSVAAASVFDLMEADSFRRFLLTPDFDTLLARADEAELRRLGEQQDATQATEAVLQQADALLAGGAEGADDAQLHSTTMIEQEVCLLPERPRSLAVRKGRGEGPVSPGGAVVRLHIDSGATSSNREVPLVLSSPSASPSATSHSLTQFERQASHSLAVPLPVPLPVHMPAPVATAPGPLHSALVDHAAAAAGTTSPGSAAENAAPNGTNAAGSRPQTGRGAGPVSIELTAVGSSAAADLRVNTNGSPDEAAAVEQDGIAQPDTPGAL